MAYWLFKSEPGCFSFADLEAAPGRVTGWDGVRNYQARNLLRDEVGRGDLVLFYHSNASPPAVAGIAEVIEAAHPDPTAFDPDAEHHDPKSDPSAPSWFQVSIRAVRPIDPPLGLPRLRGIAALANMELLRKGSRCRSSACRPPSGRRSSPSPNRPVELNCRIPPCRRSNISPSMPPTRWR